MDAVAKPSGLRANLNKLPPEKRRQVEQMVKQMEQTRQQQPESKRNQAR